MAKAQKLGKIGLVFPVAMHELKKFLPMLFMIFFMLFIYNILKITKDTIIISAAGAEAIPFVKVWVMLPTAVLMTALFTWLSQTFKLDKVFFIITSFFICSIGLFLTVIYPNREVLFLNTFADYLLTIAPTGLKGLIEAIRYWPFALFYTMAELWSPIAVFVLFWGFANKVTKVEEAKRFYPLFGVAGNTSGLFAASVLKWALSTDSVEDLEVIAVSSQWEKSVSSIGMIIVAVGVTICAIYWWLEYRVLEKEQKGQTHLTSIKSEEGIKPKKEKAKKMGFFESLGYLAQNPYVRNIAVIVVVYNVAISVAEVIWKGQVRTMYRDPVDFANYMSNVMMATAALSIFLDLFVSSNMIRKFGWTPTAMITPVIMLVTSLGFFSCLLLSAPLESIFGTLMGAGTLALTTFFGSMQNVLARASKYSLYDTTKEIVFIPLDDDCKLRAKAAIDGVGSRLGKSGGSLVLQGLMLALGGLSDSIPYVAVLIAGLLIFWFRAVKGLGKQFDDKTREQEEMVQMQEELQERPKLLANSLR